LRWIIDTSIRFRLLVVALATGIMVLGIMRLAQMPVDVVPQTSPVVVNVETQVAGLSAPEVESLVTVPLESSLREGVPGVTDVTSDSVPGLSAIEVAFAPGTGASHARELVQERLTRATALPNVSKAPVIQVPVSSTSDVMLVGLTSSKLSLIDLSVLARWAIVPRLAGLPGVANVSAIGQPDPQMEVLVDPARLVAHHVTLAQIVRTAGDAQRVPPVSYVFTPGTGGFLGAVERQITIEPTLPFGTPASMARLPVVGAAAGVRLGDVAQVVSGSQTPVDGAQERGSPGVVLVVQKSPSAGVLAVGHEVDQAIAAMAPALPGVTVDTSLFREDTYLHGALANLRTALVAAGVLAALALLALLLQLRLTCTALFAMALSLVAATAVLAVRGYTLTALVTLGLLLALALIVTEATGEAQAIADRIGPLQAAGAAGVLSGSSASSGSGRSGGSGGSGGSGRSGGSGGHAQSGSARTARMVAAACEQMRTLTGADLAALVCVVPLLLVTGLTAAFLRPMAVAFALAVIVSLVVALTITPALAAVLLTLVPPAVHGVPLPQVLGAGYARLIAAVGRAPRLTMAGAAVSAAVGVTALAALPFLHPGQPVFEDSGLIVRMTGPTGTSLSEMDKMMALATSELSALPSVADVGATVGQTATSGQVVDTNSGDLWVTINPDANYGQAVAAVQSIAEGTPGLTGSVSTYESDNMVGVLSGAPAPDDVVTRLYGTDYGELSRLAARLRTAIADISGVRRTQVQQAVEQPTVEVRVNSGAAARAGISSGDVRGEAGTLLSGLTVADDFDNQEVFDVEVEGTPAVRDDPAAAGSLELGTRDGGHVRLDQVAHLAVSSEPADIPEDDDSRYLDVTALVTSGQAGAVSAAIGSLLPYLRFPHGYHAEPVTTAPSTPSTMLSASGAYGASTSRAAFIGYVVAALVGVLLLAQGTTRSWRLAALAFGSVPVSLAGGVLMVYTLGVSGQLAASAGLLAVFALAVRQAIAVTARASRGARGAIGAIGALTARDAGLGMILTPALVTAVTLVPFVAMGDVPGMELLHTAAAVILGGLATTTLVSLFVLPVACRLLVPRLTQDPPDAVSAADAAHTPDGQHAASG
jgi:Cu/Ag efflux pump CusA